MIQRHQLLLVEALSGITVGVDPALRYINEYYAYSNSLGGGVVNQFNVRSFLSDIRNGVISNDFAMYLSSTTTSDEFIHIVGDNISLASIFNDFYETTVMGSGQSTSAPVDINLINSAAYTAYELDHLWNGTAPQTDLHNIPMSLNGSLRSDEGTTVTTRVSSEMGYYIPVFLIRNHQLTERGSFLDCPNRLSIYTDPDLFRAETTIEVEKARRSIDMELLEVDASVVQRRSLSLAPLSTASKNIVDICYSSPCIDNRLCDMLYFARKTIIELGQINHSQLSGMIRPDNTIMYADILNMMVNWMIQNGNPVAGESFSCVLDEMENRSIFI